MPAAPAHPVHAQVAVFRLAQFETHSPAEKASRKERLEARVLAAIAGLRAADRIVLDCEDGLAVVYFGEPARALAIAQAVHGAEASEVHAGLNYGPLALTARGNEGRVYGDGLAGAFAAASFAPREKLLLTESFARALQATDPQRGAELADAGEFTDTRVRQHAFYTPDPALRVVRRRRQAVYAVGGAILILLLGVVGRDIYQPLFRSRPAIVKLEVKPRGEVFVDGVSVGRTPPLTQIEVAPGKHKVQIRNPGYRTAQLEMDLQPGQRTTLAHTLSRIPEPKREPDFWRDLKKKFGS